MRYIQSRNPVLFTFVAFSQSLVYYQIKKKKEGREEERGGRKERRRGKKRGKPQGRLQTRPL